MLGYNYAASKKSAKWSIQYAVLGFEPATSWTRVSSTITARPRLVLVLFSLDLFSLKFNKSFLWRRQSSGLLLIFLFRSSHQSVGRSWLLSIQPHRPKKHYRPISYDIFVFPLLKISICISILPPPHAHTHATTVKKLFLPFHLQLRRVLIGLIGQPQIEISSLDRLRMSRAFLLITKRCILVVETLWKETHSQWFYLGTSQSFSIQSCADPAMGF